MQPLSHEDRAELARLIVTLLDSWGAGVEDQVVLLGLPEGTRPGVIRQHRQGKPFPDDAALMERVEHFTGIADALRTSYPHNAAMGGIWMNKRNHRFGDRTPLAAMVEDGLGGILAVRMHLDCAYDWQVDSAAGR